jgi:membrane protein required for colicin V production
MNKTLPFTDKKDLDDSMLYEPIKSLVPTVFPTILHKKTIEEEEDLDTLK